MNQFSCKLDGGMLHGLEYQDPAVTVDLMGKLLSPQMMGKKISDPERWHSRLHMTNPVQFLEFDMVPMIIN